MAYIDQTYYDDVYKGTPISDPNEFARLSERASDTIDQLTNYILKGVDFNSLAQFLQDQVQKATASQTEYLYLSGGSQAQHGTSQLSSVGIGQFNYQQNQKSAQAGVYVPVSPQTYELLRPTGLLYQGVNVYDSSYSPSSFDPKC